MFGCLGFIFLSVLELAIVGFADRMDRYRSKSPALRRRNATRDPISSASIRRAQHVDNTTTTTTPDLQFNKGEQTKSWAPRAGVPLLHNHPPSTPNLYGGKQDDHHSHHHKLDNAAGSLLSSPILLRRMRSSPSANEMLAGEQAQLSSVLGTDFNSPFSTWTPNANADGATKSKLNGERIDNISGKLFPFLFSVFNIVYWGYYISMSSRPVKKSND